MQIDSDFQKDLKKYKNDVKALLVCDSKTVQSIMNTLDESIQDHIEDKTITSIDDVYSVIGTAEHVANEFAKNIEAKQLSSKIKVKRACIVGIVAILLIVLVGTIAVVKDAKDSNAAYFVIDKATEYDL